MKVNVNVNESEEDKIVEEDEDLVAVADILEDAEIDKESNSEDAEIAHVADEGEMGPSWLIDDESEDAFEEDDDLFFDAKMTNDDSDSLPIRDNDNDGENEADESHNFFQTDGGATDSPISDINGVKLRPQHEIIATSDTSAPATKTMNDNKSNDDRPHLPKEGISKSLDEKQPTRSPRSNVENSTNTNIKQKTKKKPNSKGEPLFSQMVAKLQENAQQCLLHDGGTHVQPKPHQSNIQGPRLEQLNAKKKKRRKRKSKSKSYLYESTNDHTIVPAATKKSGPQTPSL